MSAQAEIKTRNLIEAGDYVFSPARYRETQRGEGKVEAVDYDAVPPVARVVVGYGQTADLEVATLLRVEHPSSRCRTDSLTRLTGAPDLVLAEVKNRLDRDTVTPCYEHMALRINRLDVRDYPRSITVELYQNLYAGD